MSSDSSAPPPLQDAVLAWAAAVEAVVRETHRIASGGMVDLAHLGDLHAAVEFARQRCEQLSASVLAAIEAKERLH